MSFKTAVAFLNNYRTERAKALNNEQVMSWSTTPVASLSALANVFESASTNATWEKVYNEIKAGKSVPSDRMQALRLSINFLAGCRRDVRIQYAAGQDVRTRVGADYSRYEYSRLAYGNYIMDLQDKVMDIRLKV